RVAECHRGGIAAVLSANADLELAPALAPALDPDAHQFADSLAVQRHEWILLEDAARDIDAEKACRVVATDAIRRLRQIVGAEGEEFGGLRNLAGHQGRARKLDHGADL